MADHTIGMTDEEFDRIYRFLKSRYGIDMNHKKEIVTGRMNNYLRANNWNSYGAFMDAMAKDQSGVLEKKLVNMLTTNHTFFMRESEHFDFMKETVLPWIKAKEAKTKDVRIWCGASSSGEEPYALEMLLAEFFGLDYAKWNTQLLATDISENVLRQAIAGVYSSEQVEVLPDAWRRRFFKKMPGGENYKVTDDLKKQLIFRKFNLMDPFPFRRKMHVIFLRNVMIYFDDPTKAELVRKVYDTLEPGGYLFIGRTETLDRGSTPLTIVKPSIYRKQEGVR